MREEEEAYHAEDIVYPLRRLAANEPDLDVSWSARAACMVRASVSLGPRFCILVVGQQ